MKTKFFMLFILLFQVGLGVAQEQAMTASEIKNFKQQVISEAQKIQTLSTDFVQYKHIDFLSKDITSSGKMLLKTPNKLNWQYDKPIKYTIIFANNKVLINDQGKKNKIDLGNSKKFEKINKMILGSISGDLFDDSQFKISYHKNKTQRIAKLRPLSKELTTYIQTVVLYFPNNQNTVSEVQLIEPSNDYTHIVFKNKQLNLTINDASFTF